MAKSKHSTSSGNQLLEVVDAAARAQYALNVAHTLVHNRIAGEGAEVDDLLVISCVLDRVNAELSDSCKLADEMRLAGGGHA